MAKIVHIEPGQAKPLEGPAAGSLKQIEIPVTPQPKTRAQRRGNAKAERLRKEHARQGQTTPAPHKTIERQKQRSRKRRREIYSLAAKADSAKGVVKPN
jgi:hypothetical protein